MKHQRIKICECDLCHDNCVPDYLDHFIQENQEIFNQADLIILERQPPMGIMNVQDLLFKLFRNKVMLINPRSVHVYFNMPKDYDLRKIKSESVAKNYLEDFYNYNNNVRKHDISDALLMVIYYYKIKIDETIDKSASVKIEHIDHEFDKFRFQAI